MGFAENLKRYRLKADMTQEELAVKLGVTRPTVTQWENGTTRPRLGKMTVIADMLGVKVSNLVEESSEEKLLQVLNDDRECRNVFMSLNREHKDQAIEYMYFLLSKEGRDA